MIAHSRVVILLAAIAIPVQASSCSSQREGDFPGAGGAGGVGGQLAVGGAGGSGGVGGAVGLCASDFPCWVY